MEVVGGRPTTDSKLQNLWRKIKDKIFNLKNRIVTWIYNHKEDLVAVAPFIFLTVRCICRMVTRVASVYEREQVTRRSIYDPREGHSWMLRRKPTIAEWKTIHHRRMNGEYLCGILESMRLIK